MAHLNLGIPARKKPTRDDFDVRPEAVRTWLDNLPYANIGETARQLFLALYKVNRLDVDMQYRFNFLEQCNTPLLRILTALRAHYVGKPFPLDTKTERVVQLAQELLGSMVVGYAIVMQQSDAHAWLSRRKWESFWSTTLHRMLHYLTGVANLLVMFHQPLPPGFWTMVHNAYVLLEENKMLDNKVAALGGEGESTLAFVYKRLLLLAMLPQQRLLPQHLDMIHQHMQYWTDALVLRKPPNTQACSETWCVDLAQDRPPGVLWKLLGGHEPNLASLRQLHMHSLLEPLTEKLKQERSLNAVTLADGITIPRELACQLLTAWDKPPQRGNERRKSDLSLRAVLGLCEIHTMLSGIGCVGEECEEILKAAKDREVQKLEIVDFDDKKESFSYSLGFIGDRDEDSDVWNRVYAAKRPRQISWTETKVARSFRLLQGQVLDQSRGGLGVQFLLAEIGSVRNGDLIAYSMDENNMHWILGMVRWFRSVADEQIQIGVQQLLEDVVPATIRIEQGGQSSQPVECLLGHVHDQLRLVLPNLSNLASRRLHLATAGQEVPVSLFELLESSISFQMFRCAENQARKEDTAETSENQVGDEFDKFKDMWELL